MFGIGATELLIILGIVVVLFGARRLPELGSGVGKAIRTSRPASREQGRDRRDAEEGRGPRGRSRGSPEASSGPALRRLDGRVGPQRGRGARAAGASRLEHEARRRRRHVATAPPRTRGSAPAASARAASARPRLRLACLQRRRIRLAQLLLQISGPAAAGSPGERRAVRIEQAHAERARPARAARRSDSRDAPETTKSGPADRILDPAPREIPATSSAPSDTSRVCARRSRRLRHEVVQVASVTTRHEREQDRGRAPPGRVPACARSRRARRRLGAARVHSATGCAGAAAARCDGRIACDRLRRRHSRRRRHAPASARRIEASRRTSRSQLSGLPSSRRRRSSVRAPRRGGAAGALAVRRREPSRSSIASRAASRPRAPARSRGEVAAEGSASNSQSLSFAGSSRSSKSAPRRRDPTPPGPRSARAPAAPRVAARPAPRDRRVRSAARRPRLDEEGVLAARAAHARAARREPRVVELEAASRTVRR